MKDTAHWVWREPYLAALREQNPVSLREYLLAAEKAILARMEVLRDAPENLPELQALRETLNSLYALEPNKSPGPPRIVEDRGEYEWGQRNWTKLGVVVAVAVIFSFATGWILARKNSGDDAQSTRTASEPKASTTTSSDRAIADIRQAHILDAPSQQLSIPPQESGADSTFPTKAENPSIAEKMRAQQEASEQSTNVASIQDHGTTSDKGQTRQTASRSLLSAAERQPSQSAPEPTSRPVESLTAEPKRSGSSSSWSLNQPKGAPESWAEPQTNPPPSIEDQPKATEVEKTPPVAQRLISPGVVTVSLSAYPSLRVPPELRSQAVGAKLQIGQVVSRVNPIYPAEAEQQRIEGTVKLHALVGSDGSVKGIEGISGPPLLAPAALSAVRQWRYQPTLLGDQPIETGRDVTIVFRLAKEAASAN